MFQAALFLFLHPLYPFVLIGCYYLLLSCFGLKGPIHRLYMYVLIKGHCRCDQSAIGLVTFESQSKEKSAYLFSKMSKIRCPIPSFCATLFHT